MAFGIGAGKMDMKLNSQVVNHGDTIQGKLTLRMKKPVKAKSLSVTLKCYELITTMKLDEGQIDMDQGIRILWHFTQELGGTDEYSSGEYPFTVMVPQDIDKGRDPMASMDGKAGQAVQAAAFLMSAAGMGPGARARNYKWRVTGRLDIPWGKDVTKGLDVQVLKPQTPPAQAAPAPAPAAVPTPTPKPRPKAKQTVPCPSCGVPLEVYAPKCANCGTEMEW